MNATGRRSFLRLAAAAGLAYACPICARLARADEVHWSYEGENGPANWGKLSADFRSCSIGLQQTPIDITGATQGKLAGIDPAFRPMPLRILNNGHTIQVNCDPGSATIIDGRPYELLQFHFHHPSEHLLAGKKFELECHFVHRSGQGNLAVLGVFLKPGAANTALAPIWAAMPKLEGPEQSAGVTIDPAALLPREHGFFRYIGSLTTPPCTESIIWSVFRDPIELSAEQVKQFAALFPMNARPIQPLNQRTLTEAG